MKKEDEIQIDIGMIYAAKYFAGREIRSIKRKEDMTILSCISSKEDMEKIISICEKDLVHIEKIKEDDFDRKELKIFHEEYFLSNFELFLSASVRMLVNSGYLQ